MTWWRHCWCPKRLARARPLCLGYAYAVAGGARRSRGWRQRLSNGPPGTDKGIPKVEILDLTMLCRGTGRSCGRTRTRGCRGALGRPMVAWWSGRMGAWGRQPAARGARGCKAMPPFMRKKMGGGRRKDLSRPHVSDMN